MKAWNQYKYRWKFQVVEIIFNKQFCSHNMIKNLVNTINIDGADYSEYTAMAKSGSILESYYTSAGVGSIKLKYQANRKKLVNHIRFFVK